MKTVKMRPLGKNEKVIFWKIQKLKKMIQASFILDG